MRSIPGTITEYVEGQDQVELLDLSPAERADAIRTTRLARARRAVNDAQAELRAARDEA